MRMPNSKCFVIAFIVSLLTIVGTRSTSSADDTIGSTAEANKKAATDQAVGFRTVKPIRVGVRGWIFKPVILLQNEVVRLEQQVVNLSTRLSGLQSEMMALKSRLSSVQEHTQGLEGQAGKVGNEMGVTVDQLRSMQLELKGLRVDLDCLSRPVA